MRRLALVFLGLSITSSWGNGHATTYRALLRALKRRGHDLLFLERDKPWYAGNRDLPAPPFATTRLYDTLDALDRHWRAAVSAADVVVVGSFVPDGPAVIDWVRRHARGLVAFYDIDTPVTVAALARGDCAYLRGDQVAGFELYLSFTGGPLLARLAETWGARRPRALYCSVDPETYHPEAVEPEWELGYLGTYSDDRQPVLERLLIEPARRLPDRRFVVAGPMYPDVAWPANVARFDHMPPDRHRRFYNAQRFTLNVTRADMVAAGWSPSVRLFEAAACGTAIISDRWPGLDSLFAPGEEILLAAQPGDTVDILRSMSESRRRAIGEAARARVLAQHTADHRAAEFERHVTQAQLNEDN